eukprot:12071580-Karenia_brevis.AAC.1
MRSPASSRAPSAHSTEVQSTVAPDDIEWEEEHDDQEDGGLPPSVSLALEKFKSEVAADVARSVQASGQGLVTSFSTLLDQRLAPIHAK